MGWLDGSEFVGGEVVGELVSSEGISFVDGMSVGGDNDGRNTTFEALIVFGLVG